jgi:LmbE family N-acetylglucosaminyl deacetylase
MRCAVSKLAAATLLACLSLGAWSASSRADARPRDVLDAAQIRLGLDRLEVVGGALFVAAHPDDENTALLAYLIGERKVRTAYLSLTRGDGGQNLIGSESGERLGVIRTQELMAARRIDGAEQFFSRAVDFGFSKNSDETLAIWGRDSILADVVRTIRTFRPDVIITRFPLDSTAGHGHHSASAILAQEAFAAAADPTRFPDQLKTLSTWQAKRVVWNLFRRAGDNRPVPPNRPWVDLGAYNELLGRSYTEIAGASRSMHKSQGFGAPERRGSQVNTFEPLAGDPAQADLFEGVDLTWARIRGGDRVPPLLRKAKEGFDPRAPHASVPALLDLHAVLAALPADPLVEAKRDELNEIIRSCLGLWVDAIAAQPSAAAGEAVRVTVTAINRSPVDVAIERIEMPFGAEASFAADAPAAGSRALADNQPVSATAMVRLPEGAAFTQPYWLRQPATAGRFVVDDASLLTSAVNPPEMLARLTVRVAGRSLSFATPVVYRWTDPVAGERYRPFEIAPAATVELDRDFYLFPDARPRAVRVSAKAAKANLSGRLRLRLPEGWKATPDAHAVTLAAADAETTVTFQVQPGRGAARMGVELEAGGRTFARRRVLIDYPHLSVQTLYPPAEAPITRADVAHRGTRVGYVMGSGDLVPEALRQTGWEVTLLDEDDVAAGAFAGYDAIVTGVRAFNTRPELRAAHARLMDYASRGGTVVIQYNTADTSLKLGPYPMRISRDRVAVEGAPVRILEPAHPLMTAPNPIGPADFDGWVQERGLYFASPFDPRYQAVLSSNDPGEPARDGGLVFARVGRGAFVYTGYAWWRQLAAGVPGAYRLFANLVSAGAAR